MDFVFQIEPYKWSVIQDVTEEKISKYIKESNAADIFRLFIHHQCHRETCEYSAISLLTNES